jgi:D-alanyl-lipoteichoic acid acyltransferase DltB (MBOAT superfamily)
VITNLLILAGFRYSNVLLGMISSNAYFSQSGDPVVNRILMPLGISFYTFTNISYLIEIKRKNSKAEKHLGYFACYVSFFPKLIQGPIERPKHFLPQLREQHIFNYNEVTSGIRLMLWGFFKKLVLADQLSSFVDAIYNNKLNWHGPLVVISTLLFAFQIYMDFSGYIDIARGAAKILGFKLTRNFNSPYLSESVKEFWARWHITLSHWLRDYIFLPLAYYLSGIMKKERYAGVATEKYIYSIAISVTFLLCGLWHGVGWNFIVWGGVFAFYLIIGSLTQKPKNVSIN